MSKIQRAAPGTFGKRLMEALRRTKKTQRELAVFLDKDETSVSKWVNGLAMPKTLVDVLRTADYLKTSVDWLLGRDAMAPPATIDRSRVKAAIKVSEEMTASLRSLDAELDSKE